MLSIYRLDKTETNRALFITFAIINSIYCSKWTSLYIPTSCSNQAQVYGMWLWTGVSATLPQRISSFGPCSAIRRHGGTTSPCASTPFFDLIGFLYAVIPLQLQHSAVTSIVVAVSEVLRRGMWTIFRVENEHCTNVGRFPRFKRCTIALRSTIA